MSDELRVYYNYYYPYTTLIRWLTYNFTIPLCHRELSFEYENDMVERYIKFNTAENMKKRMLQSNNIPRKVDAGAIWNQIPEKDSNGYTVERELIFDFDMDDYNNVRTCCSEKEICEKCWRLLVIAVEVLKAALIEDFGFEKIMYVFSGGRGLHIWVCDERARKLKDNIRKAMIDYLRLVTGNEKANSLLADRVIAPTEEFISLFCKNERISETDRNLIKKHYMDAKFHYHVERSLRIIEKYIMEVFETQNILNTQRCVYIILNILNNRSEKLKNRVQERWNDSISQGNTLNSVLWNILVDEVSLFETININEYPSRESNRERKFKKLTFVEEEIYLAFMYPRMDMAVSTSQNHLLKLPFSVHPKTQRVSIPLLESQLWNFDPRECVTLNNLMESLNEDRLSGTVHLHIGYFEEGIENEILAKRTSLRVPIEVIEELVESLK